MIIINFQEYINLAHIWNRDEFNEITFYTFNLLKF
jgi:hypothetical protein